MEGKTAHVDNHGACRGSTRVGRTKSTHRLAARVKTSFCTVFRVSLVRFMPYPVLYTGKLKKKIAKKFSNGKLHMKLLNVQNSVTPSILIC